MRGRPLGSGEPVQFATPLDARIGEVVRRARTARGWTMRQLASEAGVGLGTVDRLERGKGSTTAPLIECVLQALGYQLIVVPTWATRKAGPPQ